MPESPATQEHHRDEQSRGVLTWWHTTPLYLRIICGLLLGLIVGIVFGPSAGVLELPSKLLLRLLGALAPPLIFLAIVHALMSTKVTRATTARLIGIIALNSFMAVGLGLLVGNVFQPGRWSKPTAPTDAPTSEDTDPEAKRILDLLTKHGYRPSAERPKGAIEQFLDNTPKSLLGPFGDNSNVIGVIFFAVAFGVALRRHRDRSASTVHEFVEIAFDSIVVVLRWVIELLPLAVFGLVASIVGVRGFQPFVALGAFCGTVLTALSLQACYYLVRIRFGSWVRPVALLRGVRDALVMAFSTASSTATMPIAYDCLRNRVGLREQSASLGSLVSSSFNKDGTALWETVSALFIAQLAGISLGPGEQVTIAVMSFVAAIGSAGIPQAGLVTMTMVFAAVGLPTQYIGLLLAVDWLLDRFRTTINIFGHISVSCLLDGLRRPE